METPNGDLDASSNRARKWLQVLRTLDRFLYYFADNPTANLHEFTNEVLSELAGTSQVPPETLVTINDVTTMYIPTASASPLALIIYELLENAVRHAFLPSSDANYLLVRLVQKQGTDTDGYLWELEVTDDGIGFEFDPGSVGPGLKLVRTLVNTLGGSLEVENVSGTRIRVVIPAESESDDLDNLALSA
jgi:two-component sensor histidine kinase